MVDDSEWATGILSDVQEKYLGDVMFRENIAELAGDKGNGGIISKESNTERSIK